MKNVQVSRAQLSKTLRFLKNIKTVFQKFMIKVMTVNKLVKTKKTQER